MKGQNLSQAYKDDEKSFQNNQISNKDIKEYSSNKKTLLLNNVPTPYDQAVKNSQKL